MGKRLLSQQSGGMGNADRRSGLSKSAETNDLIGNEMALKDCIETAVKWLLGGSGTVALFYTAAQLATRRRAHVLELYRQAFAMLDEPAMREAREYVYKFMTPDAFNSEHWLYLDDPKSGLMPHTDYKDWKEHKRRAEMVGRSFDQLGLLVREGRLPLNILARFYVSPALRCWCRLRDYVEAQRKERTQPGHFWEWENLVFEIILPSIERNQGIWKGVSRHDVLEKWAAEAKHGRGNLLRDTTYSPPGRTWELGPWYKFWMW